MPYCWKLVLCPACNLANTTRMRETSQAEPAPRPPAKQSRTIIRIDPKPVEHENAPPLDQLREKLLAHRSFLMERERTLSSHDSPQIAALRKRLWELEAEHAKIRGVLEKAILYEEEDANLPGIRAKIQAIDTLLSGD